MPNAKTLGESAAVRALVGRVVSANGVVAAICAAPAMALAGFGVLDGKKATCYPGFEKHFPASAIFSEERVVVDGALVTSRGPGTALEFALAVVELLADTSTAEDLAGGMLIRR
jgi:4-methyl-5(b-hydroxyethyl)-thiazole monophosphate biosynthesis